MLASLMEMALMMGGRVVVMAQDLKDPLIEANALSERPLRQSWRVLPRCLSGRR